MKRKSLPTGRDFLFVEGYGNENPGAFQSPRPLQGATRMAWPSASASKISTHAPLAGRDFGAEDARHRTSYFNPRAPCGARPTPRPRPRRGSIFQPTRPLRGATAAKQRRDDDDDISTHAPLAGRDARDPVSLARGEISTHAPLAGRDKNVSPNQSIMLVFQPTRPLRGATFRL